LPERHCLAKKRDMNLKILTAATIFTVSLNSAHANLCDGFSEVNEIRALVIKVMDGDTIKIQYDNTTYSVRFLAVDTPETNFKQQSQGKWGEAAKAKTQSLIKVGSTVTVRFEGSTRCDRFKRLLGSIFVNDKNINTELVKAGLAVSYCFNEIIPLCYEVKAAMTYAMSNQTGFHADSNFQYPYDFRTEIQGFPDSPWVKDIVTGNQVDYADKNSIPAPRRVFLSRI
jgi:endonuclease YncB( thermonuclease family)